MTASTETTMTSTDVMSSERLVLRSADPSDFEPLYQVVFSDEQVMKQAFYDRPMSREQASEFFRDEFDFCGSGKRLGVLCLKDGTIIGFSGLLACTVLGEPDDFEIGFVLGRSFWGKGYATEIGKAQVRFGFEQAGCSRLLGVVREDNAASKRALSKSGLSFHSTVETTDRGVREVYCVLKTEWAFSNRR
ncbi:Acetyltransferase GNAT Family [Seminavis robusta]|uniref:Acetyltransferase GNAT Family n=1 Tax=Seminavis robusta TaxID=568900 RepID=A0A9N8F284_9STRA|nr:Acetyltransferase GNAT Family [Seminavis robusta]|eukprot:Sro2766_g336670.1 Acetyltransferase GNAT Family (190) ;mRNA; f:8525-9094